MAKVLPASTRPGLRLKQILLSIASQAARDVQKIHDDPALHIHLLRIRMKKLRGLLRLVESELPSEKLRSTLGQIRALKRAFSSNRDQEVMYALLKDLMNGGKAEHLPIAKPQPPNFTNGNGKRQSALTRMADKLQAGIKSLPLHSISLEEMISAHTRQYRRCRKSMWKCHRHPTAKHLHKWRKPVKELYYQSLAMYRQPGMPRQSKRARKLASLLGKHHDLTLLIRHFAKSEPEPDSIVQTVKQRRRKLSHRIDKQGLRLFDCPARKARGRLLKSATAR